MSTETENKEETAVVVKSEATQAFELKWRQAQAAAAVDFIPEHYKNKPANCLIALDKAEHLNMPLLDVMQNTHVIHGKLGWSAMFVIAAINSCGRFSPLRFAFVGEKGMLSRGCVAWAYDKADGERLEGSEVNLKMAKDENWGSKWKTMPEQMLMYRSATFFGRIYAPDVMLGMRTVDEVEDIISSSSAPPSGAAAIDALRDVTPESPAENEFSLAPNIDDEDPSGAGPNDDYQPEGATS